MLGGEWDVLDWVSGVRDEVEVGKDGEDVPTGKARPRAERWAGAHEACEI